MRYTLVAFILLFVNTPQAWAETQNKSGIYQVQQAFLNLKNCTVTGKPTEYASNFLQLKHIENNDNDRYHIST